VLLSATAATIALVLVQQTMLVARSESVRSDYDTAYQLALGAKADLEATLAADPEFYLSSLYRYERPRICTTPTSVTSVIPDEDSAASPAVPWPAACGPTWSYLITGTAGSAGAIGTRGGLDVAYIPIDHPIRAQLTPPSPGHPALGVKLLARYGRTEAGLTLSYQRGSASALTAYSASDLRLGAWNNNFDDTLTTPKTVAITGASYAAGRTFLPVAPADYTTGKVMSEGGFVGATDAGDTGLFYASAAAGAGVRGVADIRTLVPTALDMDSLRSSYQRIAALACAGAGDVSNPAPQGIPAVQFSESLCLHAGRVLHNVDDASVVVSTTGAALGPAPAAYLLMWGGSPSAPTVKIYTAAAKPALAGACVIACDLASVGAADYAAGRSPASPPAATHGSPATTLWQPLAPVGVSSEFYLPATAVIATDADTYIGQCPKSVGPAGAPACTPSTALASLTVLAGAPGTPADIYVNGPLGPATAIPPIPPTQPTPALGLVATGAVVVPYFAVESGKPLFVHANLLAMGYGQPATSSAVRAFPQLSAPSGTPGVFGGKLTVVGSVAAPSLKTPVAGWSSVALVADANSVVNPPPNFPGFSDVWRATNSARWSPYAACGVSFCGDLW